MNDKKKIKMLLYRFLCQFKDTCILMDSSFSSTEQVIVICISSRETNSRDIGSISNSKGHGVQGAPYNQKGAVFQKS